MMKLKALSAILALCACCAVVQGSISISEAFVSQYSDYNTAMRYKDATIVGRNSGNSNDIKILSGRTDRYLFVVVKSDESLYNLISYV